MRELHIHSCSESDVSLLTCCRNLEQIMPDQPLLWLSESHARDCPTNDNYVGIEHFDPPNGAALFVIQGVVILINHFYGCLGMAFSLFFFLTIPLNSGESSGKGGGSMTHYVRLVRRLHGYVHWSFPGKLVLLKAEVIMFDINYQLVSYFACVIFFLLF